MSINVEKLNRLNKLVSMFFRNKHTIVLNPEEKISNEQDLEEDVVYDGSSSRSAIQASCSRWSRARKISSLVWK